MLAKRKLRVRSKEGVWNFDAIKQFAPAHWIVLDVAAINPGNVMAFYYRTYRITGDDCFAFRIFSVDAAGFFLQTESPFIEIGEAEDAVFSTAITRFAEADYPQFSKIDVDEEGEPIFDVRLPRQDYASDT